MGGTIPVVELGFPSFFTHALYPRPFLGYDGALALIVNDYELEMFRQKTGLDVPGILKLTPHLITTRGEQGSLVQTDRGADTIPAVPVSQVLDPTGAGDAYRAGLLKGLALGLDWPEAARMGAVLASFCVEQQGTQEHRLEVPEFWGRYTEHFGAPPEAAQPGGSSVPTMAVARVLKEK